MEIGSRGGIDIMHVWNSQFVCVCVCTDEYTNGIRVFLPVR